MSAVNPLPPLYGDRTHWALVQADSLDLLKQLPDHSVDAVVTDPPYGISFRGEHWDGGALSSGAGFQAWSTLWATEARRVLRPGGYFVAFGATRTMHRLVCAAEDAGLEIRDQLLWLYSGVPKSRRLEYDLGTALKPAYEPILLARAPSRNSVAANLESWGVGALDIGATRVKDELNPDGESGRWPANVALSHDVQCRTGGCTTTCPATQLDIESNRAISRFFYAAKTSNGEREAGLAALPTSSVPIFSGSGAVPRSNVHPTVKPLAVMRWLVRLVSPPGGVVLDPFTGSGSTGCAALLEGRQFVGIEREQDYIPIARARMTHWQGQTQPPACH